MMVDALLHDQAANRDLLADVTPGAVQGSVAGPEDVVEKVEGMSGGGKAEEVPFRL
jgi:hypothetical protein